MKEKREPQKLNWKTVERYPTTGSANSAALYRRAT
jgi:hypothetical protein